MYLQNIVNCYLMSNKQQNNVAYLYTVRKVFDTVGWTLARTNLAETVHRGSSSGTQSNLEKASLTSRRPVKHKMKVVVDVKLCLV